LVEIIRRASHDWVLYREDDRSALRGLAMDAHAWLFQEGPGHVTWEERRDKGELGMSFLGICESLGLDPHAIRAGIRSLTPHRIRTLGRIPINRSRRGSIQDSLFGEDVSLVADFPSELRGTIDKEQDSMDDDVREVLLGGTQEDYW
jgi:hypothetical protein